MARELRVRPSASLVSAYWAEMASVNARGGEWIGLALYACRRLLECGYGVRDFLDLAQGGPTPFEFCVVYCVLPSALALLESAGQLERLLAAESEDEVDVVFGCRVTSAYRNWRRYLLDDVARARGHYAAFLQRRQRLRPWSEGFRLRPRVQLELLAEGLASLRGLVVVSADFDLDLDAFLAEFPDLKRFEPLLLGAPPSAQSLEASLRRVRPKLLLSRTAIGNLDEVLDCVLDFHSSGDTLAVLRRDLVESVAWPRGARILAVGGACNVKGACEVYDCVAEGLLE